METGVGDRGDKRQKQGSEAERVLRERTTGNGIEWLAVKGSGSNRGRRGESHASESFEWHAGRSNNTSKYSFASRAGKRGLRCLRAGFSAGFSYNSDVGGVTVSPGGPGAAAISVHVLSYLGRLVLARWLTHWGRLHYRFYLRQRAVGHPLPSPLVAPPCAPRRSWEYFPNPGLRVGAEA